MVQIEPVVAPRDGAPTDVMFHTGGRRQAAVWTINANASMDPNDLGTVFQHGLIQTVEQLEFAATYDGGKLAKRQAANARDADPAAPAPWYNPGATPSGPRILGKEAQAGLIDLPRNFFPIQHPKDASASINKITCKGTFNIWYVAKDLTADGTNPDNLVFLSSAQVRYEAEATVAPNGNWVGNATTANLTAPQCGKGSKTPVLNAPIASDQLAKLI